jgi:tRNA G18 (ribose-2'-O)-methylase SpoU
VRVIESYPPPHNHADPAPTGLRIRALLDNVRSALNVGTMLRAADGARLDHVHLCGVTPAADHPKVRKTALGAETEVGWSHAPDATVVLDGLRADGWSVWAVESTPASVPLAVVLGAPVPAQLVLVVGNEVAGVDPGLLRSADQQVHLPMWGAKTTLNVGVALGAVVYGIRTAEAGAGR